MTDLSLSATRVFIMVFADLTLISGLGVVFYDNFISEKRLNTFLVQNFTYASITTFLLASVVVLPAGLEIFGVSAYNVLMVAFLLMAFVFSPFAMISIWSRGVSECESVLKKSEYADETDWGGLE